MKIKNIEKLFRELLKSLNYFFFYLSYFSKRTKHIWVFGTYNNGFSDNSKYLYLFIKKNYPQINAIWISRKKEMAQKLRNLGYSAFYKKDKKGKYFLKKAKLHFTNTNLIDTSYWLSNGAKYINLWHGIPLKKIEFDIKDSTISWKYQNKNWFSFVIKKICFPALYRKPDKLLVSSQNMANIFKSAFRVGNKQLLFSSCPRTSIFKEDKNHLRSLIQKFESNKTLKLFDSLEKYDKKIVYLPTFRDGKHNALRESNIDLIRWNNLLNKNNWILLMKFHPNIKEKIENLSNIKFIESKVDIYPFLPSFDTLITDYSSIFIDFLLLNKEIIFYCYDKIAYLNKIRGTYFDYNEITPGRKCDNFKELLLALQVDDKKFENERKKMKEYFWGNSPFISMNNLVSDLIKISRNK